MPEPTHQPKRRMPNLYLTLPHRITTSPAFLTLKYSTQMVVVDMLARYNRLTEFGQHKIPAAGFPYGFPHCSLVMPRSTFSACLDAIHERGFFRRLDSSCGHGLTPRWRYHQAWRQYDPTPKERAQLIELYDRQLRQEAADRRATWTEFGHDARQIPPNPLTTYWTPRPGQMPIFRSPLTYDQDSKKQECARARGKQEPRRNDPNGPTSVSDLLTDAIKEF